MDYSRDWGFQEDGRSMLLFVSFLIIYGASLCLLNGTERGNISFLHFI